MKYKPFIQEKLNNLPPRTLYTAILYGKRVRDEKNCEIERMYFWKCLLKLREINKLTKKILYTTSLNNKLFDLNSCLPVSFRKETN